MLARHASPSRRSGARSLAALTLLAILTSTVLGGNSAGAAPPYTMEERAAAIATPALLFVEVRVEGFMRNKATRALVQPEPVVVYVRCTGFVVNADGYAVTTTHCLQPTPDSLRGAAAFPLANALIAAKKLDPAKKAEFIAQVMATVAFTGATPEAPPTSKVYGQLFSGKGALTADPAIPAEIVDTQPVAKGDVALIKLAKAGLPVAKLDSRDATSDQRVVEVGFGTHDVSTDEPEYTVQSRQTKVLGKYGGGPITRYQLDGDIGNLSHGGMVLGTNGNVLGMITSDATAKERTNRIVVGATTVASLLGSAGVKNDTTTIDATYREGLDAYFGGHYTEAIKMFDAVLEQLPNDLPAQTYRTQARDRLAIEGDDATALPAWLPAAAVVAGFVLLIAVVIVLTMFVRRRKRRPSKAGVAASPAAKPSVIVGEPAAVNASPGPAVGPVVGSGLAERPRRVDQLPYRAGMTTAPLDQPTIMDDDMNVTPLPPEPIWPTQTPYRETPIES